MPSPIADILTTPRLQSAVRPGSPGSPFGVHDLADMMGGAACRGAPLATLARSSGNLGCMTVWRPFRTGSGALAATPFLSGRSGYRRVLGGSPKTGAGLCHLLCPRNPRSFTPGCAITHKCWPRKCFRTWRGGRVAEGSGLLNRQPRHTRSAIPFVTQASSAPPALADRCTCGLICAPAYLAARASSGVRNARYNSVVLIDLCPSLCCRS
jgi:hypothetical protein